MTVQSVAAPVKEAPSEGKRHHFYFCLLKYTQEEDVKKSIHGTLEDCMTILSLQLALESRGMQISTSCKQDICFPR